MPRSELWGRVSRRLESDEARLLRATRRLLELPNPTAPDRLASEMDGLDPQGLRFLWAMLISVAHSQHRRLLAVGSGADPADAALFLRRLENAVALANRVKERLAALGHDTAPVGVDSRQKLDAYASLTRALARLSAGSPGSFAGEIREEAERLLTELGRLLATEPKGYLATDIQEAVAVVRCGIADRLNALDRNLAEAKRGYLEAAATYDSIGRKGEARACRLKTVEMVRRLAADFDEAVTELTALLDDSAGNQPSVQHAEMRVQLAETCGQIGDLFSVNQHLDLAAQEVAACGYAVPDLDDAKGSVAAWVDRADTICGTAEEFEAELTSLISLHAAALSLKGSIEKNERASAAFLRAARLYSQLGEQLTEAVASVLVTQSRERQDFVAEYGDPGDNRFQSIEPGENKVAGELKALFELDEAVGALRAEIARRQEAGAALDDLLIEAERIEREARKHHLLPTAATTLLLRADIHLGAGRFTEAIGAARTAYDLPRDASRDLTIGLWALDRIIDAYIGKRDDAAISAACGEAIELIERHRRNVSAPYSQSAYLQDRSRYYTVGIAAAYACDDFDTVLRRADLSKAGGSLRSFDHAAKNVPVSDLEAQFRAVSRQVEEALGAGDIDAAEGLAARRRVLWDLLSIARIRTASGGEVPELSVRALCASLAADEAVIYYYWLDPLVLLVAAFNQQRIIVVKKRVDEEDRRRLEEFAAFVQALRGASAYLDQVGRFSDMLLPDAIKPVLAGKRRLLFSPHRLLHALPLHALVYDKELLIRRLAVSYLPNLGCLLRHFDPADAERVFALGIRDFAVPGTELPAIDESEDEIADVAAAYRQHGIDVTTVRSQAATTAELRRLGSNGLKQFSCLHLVTHGADVLGDNPMEAFLWLRDGRLDGLEIANWRLRAELVVLSACHSGQRAISFRGNKELASDEIFGLQAAFFTAGAARVLGALWPAESRVAARLMACFHRHRADGADPEIALQAAMLEHLDTATRQTAKIYYWAPFYVAAVNRPRPAAN